MRRSVECQGPCTLRRRQALLEAAILLLQISSVGARPPRAARALTAVVAAGIAVVTNSAPAVAVAPATPVAPAPHCGGGLSGMVTAEEVGCSPQSYKRSGRASSTPLPAVPGGLESALRRGGAEEEGGRAARGGRARWSDPLAGPSTSVALRNARGAIPRHRTLLPTAKTKRRTHAERDRARQSFTPKTAT
jgi:hypothetical protein